MENPDIRWKQRFSNYKKAFSNLKEFLLVENLNKLETQGLIKAFEYTFELALKTLQDFLKEEGYSDITGPKSVIQESFKIGIISDGTTWSDMLQKRNLTSHTYNLKTADNIAADIRNSFYELFKDLYIELSGKETSNKFGLNEQRIESYKKLLSKYSKIDKILLYGSRAKGNFRPGSDIDLAVKSNNFNLDNLSKLASESMNFGFPTLLI
jgi:nucleotidyltransferase substrate binding protein (TIGR01987 family)